MLQTLGTPLLAGRDFDWEEVHEQRNVALVSESFARETWNTVEGAVGKRVDVGTDGSWQEVIGVVADVYDDGVDQAGAPDRLLAGARAGVSSPGRFLPTFG